MAKAYLNVVLFRWLKPNGNQHTFLAIALVQSLFPLQILRSKKDNKIPISTQNMLQIIKDDGWLAPYEADISARYDRYRNTLNWIKEEYGSLKKYASFHRYLGFFYDKKKAGWYYREWAPAAEALFFLNICDRLPSCLLYPSVPASLWCTGTSSCDTA
ncbi:MAG TPA: hypothetical protein ENJ53_07550, partial [Phaeodactylibacter sp.]|nr:hypothetical protein [Phaeodactylibacter sp.]